MKSILDSIIHMHVIVYVHACDCILYMYMHVIACTHAYRQAIELLSRVINPIPQRLYIHNNVHSVAKSPHNIITMTQNIIMMVQFYMDPQQSKEGKHYI